MPKHFDYDLTRLEQRILSLASSTEEAIYKAVHALQKRDAALAGEVVGSVVEIARQEIQLENECLKTLALHQPVAADLRRVVAVLKINTNLSRISDLAVNIAERVLALNSLPPVAVPASLQNMTRLTVAMVRQSLDAFVNLDSRLAGKVILMDDEVDRFNREIIEELMSQMQAVPSVVPAGISLFSAVRHIERIADHAGHIAEDVIYMVEGDIIRNGPHLARPSAR
jgi:phosphate transport system protein